MTELKTMPITYYCNSDGEPWALFTEGHVSLDSFKSAVANRNGEFPDEREIGMAELGHFYMCDVGDENDDDHDPDYSWHWCAKDDPGAIAVTGYKF